MSSTTASSSHNPTLPPPPSISRKRKRTDKTVRFDVERTVIIDTYSPLDYDRGSIFSFPVQYKINPNLLSLKQHMPTLSLEIPPSSLCDSSEEASSPDIEQEPITNKSTKKKRPKLTVNTTTLGDGPLFFTKLSTNHVKHKINTEDDDDDDIMNDYLIPVVTTPSTPY